MRNVLWHLVKYVGGGCMTKTFVKRLFSVSLANNLDKLMKLGFSATDEINQKHLTFWFTQRW